MKRLRAWFSGISCLMLLFAVAVPGHAHCNVTGSWSASTGVTMSLTHNDNSVAGPFSPGGGFISGGYGGGVWTGGWSGGGDSGGFSVVFDTGSCSSFAGTFTETGVDEVFTWGGTRVSGGNRAPEVSLGMSNNNPTPADTVEFAADAADPDGDQLTYLWFLDGVQQNATNSTVTWANPTAAEHAVRVVVTDEHGETAEASLNFSVTGAPSNRPPTVTLGMSPQNPTITDTIVFSANGADPDNDPLAYTWFIDGVQQNASRTSVDWPTPTAGDHSVRVVVSDGKGGSDEAALNFTVSEADSCECTTACRVPEQAKQLRDTSHEVSKNSAGRLNLFGPIQPEDLPQKHPKYVKNSLRVPSLVDVAAPSFVVSAGLEHWAVVALHPCTMKVQFNFIAPNGQPFHASPLQRTGLSTFSYSFNIQSTGANQHPGRWTAQLLIGGVVRASANFELNVPPPKFTQQQKFEFNQNALWWSDWAADAGMVAGGCAGLSLFPNPKALGCAALAAFISGATWRWSNSWAKMAVCPPMSQASPRSAHNANGFKALATPERITMPQVNVDGIPPALLQAFEKFIETQLMSISYNDALLKSIQRGQAAFEAGDTDWVIQHSDAASEYSAELAKLNQQLIGLSSQFKQAWTDADFPDPATISSELQAFQSELKSNGFPQEVLENLEKVGMTKDDIDDLRDTLTQKPASGLNGDFVDRLGDSDFARTVNGAVQSFDDIAKSPAGNTGNNSGPSGSIAEALDTNGNGLLDQAEIQQAIQYWIMGEAVPGAGDTISDPKIRELIQMWILGSPVGQTAQVQSLTASTHLSVRGLRLTSPRDTQRQIQLDAQNVATTQVRVFDLQGRLMAEANNGGSRVRFDLLDTDGLPLANGVYLYVVTVKGFGGERWHSGVQKLALLR